MGEESNQVSRDLAPDAQSPAAPVPPPSATTDEIREQIELTRAEMSQTIDAIQERLSPSRLASDAKESVKEATVGRVRRLATATSGAFGNGTRASLGARRVVDAVKANPMPYALVGAAATALIARSMMRSRNGGSSRNAERQTIVMGSTGNRRRLLVGVCGTGLVCWSAWRAAQAGHRTSSMSEGFAQHRHIARSESSPF